MWMLTIVAARYSISIEHCPSFVALACLLVLGNFPLLSSVTSLALIVHPVRMVTVTACLFIVAKIFLPSCELVLHQLLLLLSGEWMPATGTRSTTPDQMQSGFIADCSGLFPFRLVVRVCPVGS